jgi:hypothetical protein
MEAALEAERLCILVGLLQKLSNSWISAGLGELSGVDLNARLQSTARHGSDPGLRFLNLFRIFCHAHFLPKAFRHKQAKKVSS